LPHCAGLATPQSKITEECHEKKDTENDLPTVRATCMTDAFGFAAGP
jgi:hypothetical protein